MGVMVMVMADGAVGGGGGCWMVDTTGYNYILLNRVTYMVPRR
jgi:hypothetical protein